jgi:hypothetical protein
MSTRKRERLQKNLEAGGHPGGHPPAHPVSDSRKHPQKFLYKTTKFDSACAALADKHYSRQTHGSNQFMPPGRTLVLRDEAGSVVFGWLHQQKRDDGQAGYNCTIFRNESERLSSEIILEAEEIVRELWGPSRLFTYVDGKRVRSGNPGYCFKQAGWSLCGKSQKRGKLLFEKSLGAS